MNEDRIINKLIELDEKVDKLVTQDSFNEFRDSITTTLDAHTKMLERLDEDRLVNFERVSRIDGDVQQIKSYLNLV